MQFPYIATRADPPLRCDKSSGRTTRQSPPLTVFRAIQSVAVAMLLLPQLGESQQQDPMSMNGGSVLAMAGDECVALAVDKRFGSGNQMVNIAPRHVLAPSSQLIVAFTGLEGDIQTLSQDLSSQVSSKLGRGLGFMNSDSRQRQAVISPRAMASLTSHVMYNRRQSPYYVEPLVVGLSPIARKPTDHSDAENDNGTRLDTKRLKYRPFLCSMDVIGAKSCSDAFVCAGVASGSMFGTAEALWKPGMKSQELADVCAKAFLSALERDCLSGYGALLYLITKDGIFEYDLVSRND